MRELVALVLIAALQAPGAVRADDPALWQARSCVGESGWYDLETCAAMAHVHQRRARRQGLPFEVLVRRYSRAVWPRTRRRWLLELNRSGTRPASWPPNASWQRRRRPWLRILRLADAFVRNEVRNPCRGAIHYGSVQYDPVPEGTTRHSCLPASGQAFYQ
jgi:hypothetical protein